MQAAISHSGGTDVIVFENFPTKSRNFAPTMENITKKNFKATVRTEGIKVKVRVIDQFDTYNPVQLEQRKYIFAPLIAAILVLPLLVALGCRFDKSKPMRIAVPFSTLLPQAFCIFGPPTAAHFGCGGTMGTPCGC